MKEPSMGEVWIFIGATQYTSLHKMRVSVTFALACLGWGGRHLF